MLRRFRSRFGISAPRVAVRTHIPWYLRALATIAILSISIALAGWVYDAGRKIAGFDRRETEQEITALRSRVEELEQEAAVEVHGARDVTEEHEPHLPVPALPPPQLHQLALHHVGADAAPQVHDAAPPYRPPVPR